MKEDNKNSDIRKQLRKLEQEINAADFQKMLQRDALIRAFCCETIKGKIRLLADVLLEKAGRIPACYVEKYHYDKQLFYELQELEKHILLNEICEKTESAAASLPVKEGEMVGKTGIVIKKEIAETEQNFIKKLQTGYLAIITETLDKGGVEQVIELLAVGFTKRQIKVKILCLQSGGRTAERLEKSGIEVRCFHNDQKAFEQFVKKNPPLLANTHYVKRYIRFLYAQGIPVVEVIHNMYLFYDRNLQRRERKNERYFTKLIAVSELVKQTYIKRICDTQKIEVVGNAAVLRECSQKTPEEIRRKLGISEQAYVFLNVGSIDRRKNQEGTIRAYDIVAEKADVPVYLVLAGNTLEAEYEQELQKTIESCTHKDRIIILPFYEQVGDLYQMADALLLNSYYEGWSIAATEALYEGLPILHSYCGSAVELTQNGAYGKIVSNPLHSIMELSTTEILRSIRYGRIENLSEVVHAMLDMIAERDSWRAKRKQIAAEAQSMFSQEQMVQGYLKIFSEIV